MRAAYINAFLEVKRRLATVPLRGRRVLLDSKVWRLWWPMSVTLRVEATSLGRVRLALAAVEAATPRRTPRRPLDLMGTVSQYEVMKRLGKAR